MKLASEKLTKHLHTGTEANLAPVIFKAGTQDDKPLTKSEIKSLLERVRSGEAISVEVVATTYIQRSSANRNAIRFKDTASALKKIAKSGMKNPVLRDHDQSSVMARGGTVLKSYAEQVGDEWHFKQRLELVKPWAVEGVLDGTIDRFSIGWFPTGPILYSHTGKEIEGWPTHWPGEELEDGTVVEWVYTEAELIEVSGVNVPAVTGTHIEGIRSALSVETAPQQQREKQEPKEHGMKKSLLSILGLAATVSDEAVTESVSELKATNESHRIELDVLKTELAASLAVSEAAQKADAKRSAKQLEADIAGLYSSGKLLYAQGEKDAAEADLRKLHGVGRELFLRTAERLAVKGPALKTQSDDAATDEESGAYDGNRLTRLRSCGMTPERHAELSARRAQRQGRS